MKIDSAGEGAVRRRVQAGQRIALHVEVVEGDHVVEVQMVEAREPVATEIEKAEPSVRSDPSRCEVGELVVRQIEFLQRAEVTKRPGLDRPDAIAAERDPLQTSQSPERVRLDPIDLIVIQL